MKNPPKTRKCIACRQTDQKRALVRVVKTPEGVVAVDAGGKMNGRGAYICSSAECLAKAKKTRAFNRAFKCEVDQSVYGQLESIIDERQG